MEIVGYVAYGTIVILAIVWSIDVRINLGSEKPAILRAVYFVSSSVLVPAFDVNLGHCLWLAPFGCFFARMIAPRLIKTPFISFPFIVIADAVERFVHVGIPRHKIEEAQAIAMKLNDSCDVEKSGAI